MLYYILCHVLKNAVTLAELPFHPVSFQLWLLSRLNGVQQISSSQTPNSSGHRSIQNSTPNSRDQLRAPMLLSNHLSNNPPVSPLFPGLSSQQLSLARIQRLNPKSKSAGPVVSLCLIPQWWVSFLLWAKYPHAHSSQLLITILSGWPPQ